jgi:hypothetical protein
MIVHWPVLHYGGGDYADRMLFDDRNYCWQCLSQRSDRASISDGTSLAGTDWVYCLPEGLRHR